MHAIIVGNFPDYRYNYLLLYCECCDTLYITSYTTAAPWNDHIDRVKPNPQQVSLPVFVMSSRVVGDQNSQIRRVPAHNRK